MIKIKEITFQGIKQKFQVKKPWDDVIIFILNILIAIPIFIIVHQNLINPNWLFNIDRVVLFLFIIVIIQLILTIFENHHSHLYALIFIGFILRFNNRKLWI